MSALRTAFGVLGLAAFATAAMCGVLVTALAPISEESWWLWPALRALLQLGGGLWGGLAVAALAQASTGGYLKLAAAGTLLGGLLTLNPLLDLARGPLTVDHAQILAAGTRSFDGWDVRPGGVTPRGDGIEGDLAIATSDGAVHRFTPMGLQANRLDDMLAGCRTATDARVVALRHLDVVVALRCGG